MRSDLDTDPDFKEMMLNTDMCLLWKENIDYAKCIVNGDAVAIRLGTDTSCDSVNDPVTLYAATDECCAWTDITLLHNWGIVDTSQAYTHCGTDFGWHKDSSGQRDSCCDTSIGGSSNDCEYAKVPNGPAADAVLFMAKTETAFYNKWMLAWNIATTNGHSDLSVLYNLDVPEDTYDCASYDKDGCNLDTLYCEYDKKSATCSNI